MNKMDMKDVLALMRELSNDRDLSTLTDEQKVWVAEFVLLHGGHPIDNNGNEKAMQRH